VLLWRSVLGVLLHLGAFNIENAPRCILVPSCVYIYILVVLDLDFYVYIQMDNDESRYIYKTHMYINYSMNILIF
jgi:hypothetical protein